jgi:hypothetical protein
MQIVAQYSLSIICSDYRRFGLISQIVYRLKDFSRFPSCTHMVQHASSQYEMI